MFLIKNAIVIDPNSSKNGKKVDILVSKGQIKDIGKNITSKSAKIVEGENLHVSIGWYDIGVQVGEPGFEHREDLTSLAATAAAGGYTGLACFPNTEPAIHSKSEVNFLKNHSQLVDFHPIGALSRNCEGKDLAELYDMATSGAVAFSDGSKAISSAGLMKRGLEYLKGINGLLINHPFDHSLGKEGQLHEGLISTKLGMKGIPALAETLMLKRDLDLLSYTQSRLHVQNISTTASVKLIKAAKNKGLAVTASVSIMNLVYDHEALETFDPNFKVLPPLRQKEDIKALWKGVQDGTIDVINSNHTPLELEAKKLEFAYADFGTIGLETTYALLNTQFGDKLEVAAIVNLLAIQPRRVLNLSIPTIAVGANANLTLFQPTKEWIYQQKNILSKSSNSPEIGKTFRGKVKGIINGNYSNL